MSADKLVSKSQRFCFGLDKRERVIALQGKKISNIKTVAELAKVSIATVSRVMNNSANVSDELRDRVYRAIDETSYSANPIASTLKSSRRGQAAIVIPSLRQTYYTDIIKGVSDYFYNNHIIPIILESGNDVDNEKRIIENLERQWVDGIVFIPSHNLSTPGYKEFIDSLTQLRKKDNRISVVLAECSGLSSDLDCVRVDYKDTFYRMTYHLLEIGRKRISYLSSPVVCPLHDVCMEAFRKAISDYGGDVKEEMVECAEYTILAGYNAMKKVLADNPSVDGVVCTNDQVAVGALAACKESGLPHADKIAVIGYGGVAVSIITSPSISTMIAPRYRLGNEAARLLHERINGSLKEPEELLLSTHLAIRTSTMKSASKNLDIMFAE